MCFLIVVFYSRVFAVVETSTCKINMMHFSLAQRAPRTRTQAFKRRCHRKLEAAFAASRFLWRRRICGFTGICHCTRVKG